MGGWQEGVVLAAGGAEVAGGAVGGPAARAGLRAVLQVPAAELRLAGEGAADRLAQLGVLSLGRAADGLDLRVRQADPPDLRLRRGGKLRLRRAPHRPHREAEVT